MRTLKTILSAIVMAFVLMLAAPTVTAQKLTKDEVKAVVATPGFKWGERCFSHGVTPALRAGALRPNSTTLP